jgi:hypothetical protein
MSSARGRLRRTIRRQPTATAGAARRLFVRRRNAALLFAPLADLTRTGRVAAAPSAPDSLLMPSGHPINGIRRPINRLRYHDPSGCIHPGASQRGTNLPRKYPGMHDRSRLCIRASMPAPQIRSRHPVQLGCRHRQRAPSRPAVEVARPGDALHRRVVQSAEPTHRNVRHLLSLTSRRFPVCISISISIYLSIYLSIFLSIYLSIYLIQ